MNWKIWLILISVVIYCIWAIFLNYTVVKKVERVDYYSRRLGETTYEKLPIPIWLILVILTTLFVPVLNIIGSVAIFWIYLSAMDEEYDGVELQAKDDWFCNLLHNIGDFLSKPIN